MGRPSQVASAVALAASAVLCTARAGGLSGPMVVSDAWPQATDPASFARDVLRIEGLTWASERDQAIALYRWTRLFVMTPKAGTEPYEGPYGQEARLVEDVNKVMFVHGCGDCDYQARALEAVWARFKSDDLAARRLNAMSVPHTMSELRWGGAWHSFDVMNGVYFLERDGPAADVLSMARQISAGNLLRANEHFLHRGRPFFERVRGWDQPGGEWKMHLDFRAFFESGGAWAAAGHPADAVIATHSRPSTLPLHDMRWRLPRGATVERRWSADSNFYAPRALAGRFGQQGRHYRQAVEWGPALSRWSAAEDPHGFPKVEPYLERCTDPSDADFFGQHTLYLVGSGTYTWEADLWSDAWLDAVEGTPTLVRADGPPYLRPRAASSTQRLTFRIRSPYIIADAELSALVVQGPSDEARLLLSTDGGESWEPLVSGGGAASVNLGKSRFDGTRQSVTGKYDYLVRFECVANADPASVGLSRLRLRTFIDGSLNALPRAVAGENAIRVVVDDAGGIRAPLRVEYRWRAGTLEASHVQRLEAQDFAGNTASFRFQAPGLTRCLSYSFSYGGSDEEGNGLPDGWERHWFGDAGQVPGADADGDGSSNIEEFEAGTVPTSGGPWRGRLGDPPGGAQQAARSCGGCTSGWPLLPAFLGLAGLCRWAMLRGRS